MKQVFKQKVEKRSTELIALAAAVILVGSVVQAQSGVLDAGTSSGSGLIAEYRFETGAGNTVYDTAGDNDGTVNGATWASGLEGGAMKFDGSSSVSLDSSSDLPSGSEAFTLSTWIKVPADCSTNGGVFGYGNWGSGDQTNALRTDSSCTGLRHYFWGNDISTGDIGINDGRWHHVAVTYDGSTRKMFIDGKQQGSDSPGSVNMQVQDVNIGVTNGNEYFNGKINSLKVYSEALDASQVRSLQNSGSWRVGSTTEEDDPDKILDMSFQHQNSSHVYDESGYDNHGNVRSGTTQKSALNCRVGRCYSFDGTSSGVDLNDIWSDHTESRTFMFWFKEAESGASGGDRIISQDCSEWFCMNDNGQDSILLAIDGYSHKTVSIDESKWNHASLVFNESSSNFQFYLNGIKKYEQSYNSGWSYLTRPVVLGANTEGSDDLTGGHWEGKIDQLKVFNRSLSQQEVVEQTSGLSSGGAIADVRLNREAGNKALDYSGENPLTLQNSPQWTNGISGNALKFEGSNHEYARSSQSVKVPEEGTITGWIRGKASEQVGDNIYPFGLRRVSVLGPSGGGSGRSGLIVRNNSNNYYWGWGDQDVYDGEWHQYTVTWTDTQVKLYIDGEQIGSPKAENGEIPVGDSRDVVIGEAWSPDNYGPHTGKIDQVKILPYAASKDRIKRWYSAGRTHIKRDSGQNSLQDSLVLSQTFDRIENCGQSDTISCPSGMSGEVSVDESGKANHGDLTDGSQRSAGCVSGRCLYFDGNDNVDLGDKLGFEGRPDHTIAFWAKPKPSSGSYPRLISKEESGSRTGWTILRSNSGDTLNYERRSSDGSWSGGTSISYKPNEWSHFVYAFDNDTGYFYRNGKRVGSGSSFAKIGSSTSNLYIGARNGGGSWDSPLDQLRIYNRTLSDKEVWKLYTKGRDRSAGEVGASSSWEMNTPGYGVGDSSGENDGTLKPNLLDNSGFESGGDSTGNMNRIVTNYAGNSKIVTEESKSGRYSGKHIKTGEDDQWSAVTWDLTSLEAGKTYDFGVWYKCNGDVESSDFDVGIANGTGWNRVGYIDLGEYKCDDRWHFASGESPELPSGMQNTNRVRFTWGYSTSSGTMYVDDMYLREDDADWAESVRKGRVLNFDGSGDHVQLEQSAVMEKEGSTLIWSMNPDGTSNTGLFSNNPSGLDNHIQVRSNKIRTETQQNCNNFDFSQFDKEAGWSTYAIVFDNSRAYLYENGKLLGEATSYGLQSCGGSSANGLVSDMSFQYIGSKTGYDPSFDGELGSVEIYPYALNQEQVKKVMNSGAVSVTG